MSRRRTRKKDELQEQQNIMEDELVPEGIMTRRRSRAVAVDTVQTNSSDTPKRSIPKLKLKKDAIENMIMGDSDDESVVSIGSEESIGKSENNISNFAMDDHSITVKIRRMSDQKTYKVVDYKIGMVKKDDAPAKSTEPIGRTRNRKSMHQRLNEDELLQEWQNVYHKKSTRQTRGENGQDTPKTPKKRPTNRQTEREPSSEVENKMPNGNVSPKRSKIVESRQFANTPTKRRTTALSYTPSKSTSALANTPSKRTPMKKSVKSSLLETPSKAFSKLQIDTPRARRTVKPPLESNTTKQNTQDSSKRYGLRTKTCNALYIDYDSNSESGDDGDKSFDANNESVSSEDEEDEEDDASDNSEIYSPKRPKSAKKMPNLLKTPSKNKLKTPSKVSMETPTKLISRMSLNSLTPSVHRRTINIVKPSTPLQEARQKLHVSVLPKSLPCREEEFNDIYSFLHSRLSDLSGGCIYVSGVPGTGKTATVNEVIRCLKKSMNAGKLDEFEFIEINGMKLSEPRQAYVQIWKQLTGNQTTWEEAQKLLNNRFTTANAKRGMTLLLVDELDLLCTKRQDVVYNLLDWPSKATAKLVVVTIANTMDLPERILMGKVTSRLGLTRLTFPPYNHKQLEEIVVSRLKGYNAFSGETVQLVARKVAAVSGDARRALDICRRATEVAEMNDREMVTMMDVKKALDEMIASPKIQAIKACSDLEKVFLQAVCSEVHRTGVEEVLFKNVYYQLETLCTFEGEKIPNITESLAMCARLGAWRLLLCDHSRLDIHQRLLLNVSTDDVHFAIKNVVA